MKLRIPAILLVCAMLLGAAACGTAKPTDTPPATDSAADTQPPVTEPVTEPAPETMYPTEDYDGREIRIRYFGHADYEKYDALGDNSGEGIADTVYDRNRTVEDALKIKLTWIPGSADWLGYPAEIETMILSGDTSFDVGWMELQKCFPQAVAGYYRDLKDSDRISLDDPWWYKNLIDQTRLNDRHLYSLSGAFSVVTMLKAGAVFFNKGMWTDRYGDTQALYDMVREEKWTLDAMQKICHEVYKDVNGDGKLDAGDIYGFCHDGNTTINYFSMCSGLSFTTRNEAGDPVLNLYNDDVVRLADLLYQIMWDGQTCYYTDGTMTGLKAFTGQNALFYNKFLLHALTSVRDTEFEWGILPIPALNEKSGYCSAASTVSGESAFIPNTAADADVGFFCAVMNALAAEAYQSVIPTSYEMLRSKYSSEPADAEMVKVIHDSISCHFIMAATLSLNNLGSIFQECANNKLNGGGYARYWAANEKAYQTALEDLIRSSKS